MQKQSIFKIRQLKILCFKFFFLGLSQNGAIRIELQSDDAKTYTETNKFESCSSGYQEGGSLYFGEQGEFVQTKNSFINSTNLDAGTSFSIQVSEKPNYKNHANETLVYNCGSSEQVCGITTFMLYGFIIMNECNITQNRVKQDTGGYFTASITSDSYITCVNVIENNQTYNEFNWHSSYSSIFKVTSGNYIRNKSPNDGYLINSRSSDVFMGYCCIRENEIPNIFWAYYSTITFENSTTDNTTSYGYQTSPIFKNTDISFENYCHLLKIEFLDSLKDKCLHSNSQNKTDEFDKFWKIYRRR
ncbi:hypothetical protein TVAG_185320 [Trichomonas vaginalis G3]|uniref:Right handed beta helix domain-containing protein n=1 Tax=Trichomonas vaginalis (strain ATCC PRA-98 / G3) TaxID=412133 RepID=A2D8H7_TRIV3|nr:hypothetical protein TVAGG3_0393060 [Trichomonas vaginalis G3]EAY23226.1 hypothetical protein TVAG_185320 [Trichomonas vaginalis G3]KAI5534125.1 hypothetical protein TVAGG3_0393060 [Trichomonas vaginalis G3]|eukprot:XP_001584212.1 hypothetical protein [Trichomonas vaginalis G3]